MFRDPLGYGQIKVFGGFLDIAVQRLFEPRAHEPFVFMTLIRHNLIDGVIHPKKEQVKLFYIFLRKYVDGCKTPVYCPVKMTRRKGKFVGAYIPKDIKRKLAAQAAAQDRPLSWVIEKILAQGVKHQSALVLKEAA